MTDIPPSRYKIVEKDGRLIVYDKGALISSGTGKRATPFEPTKAAPIKASWALSSKGSAPAPDSPSARFGRLSDRVAALLARRRNADGTLVIRKTKKEGLRSRTMEATMTVEQARIYGMSMLSFGPFALGMLLIFVASGAIVVPLVILGLPLMIFGVVRLGALFDKLEWRDLSS